MFKFEPSRSPPARSSSAATSSPGAEWKFRQVTESVVDHGKLLVEPSPEAMPGCSSRASFQTSGSRPLTNPSRPPQTATGRALSPAFSYPRSGALGARQQRAANPAAWVALDTGPAGRRG